MNMNIPTSENIQHFFENAASSSVEAMKTQAAYFEAMIKRNAKVFSTLAGQSLSSLKEVAGSKTFSQAFEANLAFEAAVREELEKLHEDNMKAWDSFQSSIKSLYTPATAAKAEPKKAEPKKAAPVAKKTQPKPKKAAPKVQKAA